MRYVAFGSGIVDTSSGYPFEGWNHDPKNGLFLRSFTQLTAIGLYLELLANVVAGAADTPGLSREQARDELAHLVATLRADQRNPRLAAKGLLVNFMDLSDGKRLGPLAADVDRSAFLEAFGEQRGDAIWKALQAKGWIVPRNDNREATIQRNEVYGATHFDGPLAPHSEKATNRKVMELLDRRVVMVVFGDNANLSTAVAKAIGALLTPEIADQPAVVAIRRELARFLAEQEEGYTYLYDANVGLFYFGWDATRGRLFGWENEQGRWTTGHMDYFVNEFRGPATFVTARFRLPWEAVGNLGFKIKPYRTRQGATLYPLAPWDGSAFQLLGLGLSLNEPKRPSWREILHEAVDVEIDYSTRKDLPGFLSESYTGDGVQYTGNVGIPEITVSSSPRLTSAASLYTLGVAYSIEADKTEHFLASQWPRISSLLTDHGPWEGYNVDQRKPIEFQTSAHTLSLILGLLGTGSANMERYARHHGLRDRLEEAFVPGEGADLLTQPGNVFAWTGKKGDVKCTRPEQKVHVTGTEDGLVGLAFVAEPAAGINLSGTRMTIRYRCGRPMDPVQIAFKSTLRGGLISKEVVTRFETTNGDEKTVEVTLPAMVGLSRVKEVVISHEHGGEGQPVDLTVSRLDFRPLSPP
jgi:hypothetical protein